MTAVVSQSARSKARLHVHHKETIKLLGGGVNNSCVSHIIDITHHSPCFLSSCTRDLACCEVVASPCNGALTSNDSFSLLIGGCSCDSSCESVSEVKGKTACAPQRKQ